MSLEMCDQILSRLHLSLLDVMEAESLRRYLGSEHCEATLYSVLPVLSGRVGPAHIWPVDVERHERFPVPATATAGMWRPVVARVSEDLRMYPLFSDGDCMLLDQGHRARTELDPDALYVIKRGRVGLVRRLRTVEKAVYMVSQDAIDSFADWERLPVESQTLTHFVRARAVLVARELEWEAAAGSQATPAA
jgi:hypothetical protein